MNKTSKILWFALLIISVIGVIFMVINTYTLDGNHKPGTRSGAVRWKEYLILPFYFTFLSNIFGVITGIIVNNDNYKGKTKTTNIHLFRFKLLTAVCLTITLIVYWTLLGPKSIPTQSPREIMANLMVHGMTPLLFVIAYFYEIMTNDRPKYDLKKTLSLFIIFPIAWVIVATIIYYSLGAGPEDAVYSFLRFEQNPWWASTMYIIGIGISFIGFICLYIWINNRKQKTKEVI